MPIKVGRNYVNKRKLMRGDLLVLMIEFATKKSVIKGKKCQQIYE